MNEIFKKYYYQCINFDAILFSNLSSGLLKLILKKIMDPRTQTFISWKGDYPIHIHLGA
jgi:hypothetical protein